MEVIAELVRSRELAAVWFVTVEVHRVDPRRPSSENSQSP